MLSSVRVIILLMPKTNDTRTEYWFIFQNERLLVSSQKNYPPLLTKSTVMQLQDALIRQHYVGQFQDFDLYCAEIHIEHPLPAGIELITLRKGLELLGPDWFPIATKAFTIITWDKNHQFCGRCGEITAHRAGSFERACTNCGLLFYPRISPSIVVLIHRGNEILMARSPHFTPGAYGLIAGFVEAGENAEDAVHREVKEEVGITIKNLRYFGSQPWPFPDSLMFGYFAEYDAGELVMDRTELEDAGWYHFDKLPGRPSLNFVMSARLLDHFIAEQRRK